MQAQNYFNTVFRFKGSANAYMMDEWSKAPGLISVFPKRVSISTQQQQKTFYRLHKIHLFHMHIFFYIIENLYFMYILMLET